MKILCISSRFPYPPLKGDQVILYNRLRHLPPDYEITLLTFYQKDEELNNLEEIKKFCRVETVKISPLASAANLFLYSAFFGIPFQSIYFRSGLFMKKLRQLLAGEKFDVVHTYMLRMAEYTRGLAAPKILDLIDCMQLNLKKRREDVPYPKKILYAAELQRIRSYENKTAGEYDAALVVSDADRHFLAAENARTIPLGIDVEKFRPEPGKSPGKTIIFSGNMAYQPNENAVNWFMEKCFGQIRQEVPEVRLKIVGVNPGRNVRRYHDGQTVFVTGWVDSVVKEMADAALAIAPMQSGYGMHIKILEAMSCGLPVVTTSSGRGTIAATDGVHLCLADEPRSFAGRCVKLLNHPALAQSMGMSARDLVVKQYSWVAHTTKLRNVYETVVHKSINQKDNL